MKKALAGLKFTVPVTLDVSKLDKLPPQVVPVIFDAGKIDKLGPQVIPVDVTMDPGAMAAGIRVLQAKIRQAGLADFLDVDIPTGKVLAQLQLLKRLMSSVGLTDLLGFSLNRGQLESQLKKLAGITADIPVNFDLSRLPAEAAKVGDLAAQTIPVTFDVSKIPTLGVGAEKIRADWQIPPLKPLADAMAAGVHETIPVTFDVGSIPTLGTAQSLTEHIDTSAAIASLASLDTKLVQTSLDAIATARSLKELAAADALLAGQDARLSASFRDLATAQGLTSAAAKGLNTELKSKVTDVEAVSGVLPRMAAGLLAAAAAFGKGGVGAIGWGGALTATIPILGLLITSVSAWHIVLDGIIEALIAVTLGAAALAAGLLAAAPAAQDIYTHLKAVQTVSSALGQTIKPLTGQFDALASAMAPQVIEIYGGALDLISSKTGGLGQIAARVVTIFDDWIAKIDLFAGNKNFNQFLQSGIGYLSQFASILGNVGVALTQLLTKDPGIAKFLLDLINGVAQAVKWFSGLPAVVVAGVLALHGLYVWSSVLLPLVLKLTAYLLGLGASFLTLIANPFFWVAAAVVGLAALAYQSGQATSAAKAFNAAIESGLANDTASQAILGIASAVGQLTTQIQSTSGPVNAMKQWNAQSESLSGGFQRLGYNLRATGAAFGKAFGDIPQSLQTWGTLGRLVKDFGHAFANFFSSSAGASVAASNNIKAYDAEITKLIAQQSILFRVAGQLVSGNNSLTKSSYTLAQAFALEDLAGVKSTDSLALADQKVRNLITGYQSMSVQGAILSSSVNAVTFASLQQQSGISNLTSAWTAFITLVTGGEAAFTTFQQQINTISHDLSGIAPAAITGSTALGGLSAASLQASSAFTTGVNQGNSLINALTMQASASGLATRGTDLLTAAVKDTVAQMIPMAGNSVAAQAALIALAQQGGFPASGSFQDLAKWVGTASGTMGAAGAAGGPAAQLNTITGILAKSSQNLTTDVQNLSTALGTTLSNAEAGAIALARGGVKPFNDFATAVANTGVSSDATRQAAIKLGDEFLQLAGNNVPAAQKEFESFAIGGLGLSQSQADALWNDILNNGIPALTNVGGKAVTAESQFAALAHNGLGLTQTQAQSLWSMFNQQNLDVMSTKAGGAKAQFIALAMNGLNLTNTQAQSLWRMFVQQKLDEAGTKAGETRAQFETLAGQLGLTKGAADKLWASLHAVAAGSPYTAVLHENGQGLFTITGTVIAASQGAGGSGNAAGGLASGGVVGQTMPVMVSKGEMVFSPSDSQRLAPAFRSLGVPGFAAGGYPSPGAFTGLVTRGTTPTADDVMVKVAKGSTVVSAEDSKKLASALGSGPPRYASGGYAAPGNYSGGFGGQAPATAQFTADFNNDMTGAMKTAMTAALKAAEAAAIAKAKAAAAAAAAGAYAGAGSGNYAADITAVLKVFGLMPSLLANWLRQIQTESGGSLTAVNRTDSNAQQGHPSVGLLQIIPSTFAAYSGPYRNTPPLVNEGGGTVSENAMAQIYTAIHYADVVYHGNAMDQVIGRGLGYALGGVVMDSGGWLKPGWNPPVYNGTGRAEQVTPAGASTALEAKLDKVVARLDAHIALTRKLIDTTAAVPSGVGRHLGGALSGAASTASFRARYPRGGA